MIWFSRRNNNQAVYDIMPANFVTASEAFFLAWAFVLGGIGGLTGAAAEMVRDLFRIDPDRSNQRLKAARESSIPMWAFCAVLFLIGGGAGLLTFFVLWMVGIAEAVTPLQTLSACVLMGAILGSASVGGVMLEALAKTAKLFRLGGKP